MPIDATIRNHSRMVPHPDKQIARSGVKVAAEETPDWKPIRRLLCRAFEVATDCRIASDLHGMLECVRGDFVVQDEVGQLHKLTPDQFDRQFVFTDTPNPFAVAKPSAPPFAPAKPLEEAAEVPA